MDMESYQLVAQKPWMGLSSKSQTSSNLTSSLKECETTKLHSRFPSFVQYVRIASSDQNATASNSGQNVSLNNLARYLVTRRVA